MYYKKAFAEVVSLNNADVITTYSGNQNLVGLDPALLAEQLGCTVDHAKLIIDAAGGTLSSKSFVDLITSGALAILDVDTVDEAQRAVNGIHNTCRLIIGSNATAWSPETENVSFDEEWDDSDSEW